jgi:hypothetical protein
MTWADSNQIEVTNKLKKRAQISGSVKSPSGGNSNSMATKATPFEHPNSNLILATSA